MAGTLGNKNSSRENRLWADTIRRIAVQSEGERIRKIAEKLYAMAEDGDIQSIKEIGDRLDGKPSQSVALAGDPDNPTPIPQRIELVDLVGIGTGSATS